MIKIAFISDLHTKHDEWELIMDNKGMLDGIKKSDIIVFCGDMSSRGTKQECKDFLDWFNNFCPKSQKIFIAGNHDFWWEESPEYAINDLISKYPNLTYLNDSSHEIMGLKFWGSPVTPRFRDWAFNRDRGEEIMKHWNLIPHDIDVLITHGPPKYQQDLLDKRFRSLWEDPYVGCNDLANVVQKIKPIVHAFGHIHENFGGNEEDGIIYVNASSLNELYQPVNPPYVLNVTK